MNQQLVEQMQTANEFKLRPRETIHCFQCNLKPPHLSSTWTAHTHTPDGCCCCCCGHSYSTTSATASQANDDDNDNNSPLCQPVLSDLLITASNLKFHNWTARTLILSDNFPWWFGSARLTSSEEKKIRR